MSGAGLPYDLYGLTEGNPYVHRIIDPLKRPGDIDRLLELNCLIQHDQISSYLRQKIADQETAFILIGGRNLTGRTSLANWVLGQYFDLREVDRRFLDIRMEVTNHNNSEWFSAAMRKLWARTKTVSGLVLNPEVADELKKSVDGASPFYEELFQVALYELSVQLENRKERYALGFVFEGMKNAEFVTTVKAIFDGSMALVVFTYDDYDHAQTTDARAFRTDQFDGILDVHLEPLGGPQVCVLAERRWQNASDRKFPFDAAGLEALYKDRPTPIKMVLKGLQDLLDYRLELAMPYANPWPENDALFMSSHWLMTTSKFKEKSS